ncbi:MAG: hypothetical protein QMD82_02510 [bacterium]|nr:hypothetical protein [bacterium]
MIGIDLDFETFRFIRRERGRILEFLEGSVKDLGKLKGEDIYISFSAPRVVGKFYENRVNQRVVEEEFGVSFEIRKKVFKIGNKNLTFIGAVERETYESAMNLIESLKISRIKRIDFSPFVFHDLLYTLNFSSRYKDFLAIYFGKSCFYYAVCKEGTIRLVSSAEMESYSNIVSELVKTFFEEGLTLAVVSGDYTKELTMELKEIAEDVDVEILNPFAGFSIMTPEEVKQTLYSLALGVTL